MSVARELRVRLYGFLFEVCPIPRWKHKAAANPRKEAKPA